MVCPDRVPPFHPGFPPRRPRPIAGDPGISLKTVSPYKDQGAEFRDRRPASGFFEACSLPPDSSCFLLSLLAVAGSLISDP